MPDGISEKCASWNVFWNQRHDLNSRNAKIRNNARGCERECRLESINIEMAAAREGRVLLRSPKRDASQVRSEE